MNVAFKQDQVYRGDYTFSNSPAAIRRFPMPFPEDRYMYSVNIEPHVAGPAGSVIEFPIDCDEHYVEECRDRAIVLEHDPLRFQALPHMMSAQWDTLELGMQSLSASYPHWFTLTRNGREWHWIKSGRWGSISKFIFGDPASPCRSRRSNTSRASCRATGSSWISATTIFGSRVAWSRALPTGPWTSTWV